ncbi:MAG: hypothetical protein EZS28_013840, partial [Streblomastix strix]
MSLDVTVSSDDKPDCVCTSEHYDEGCTCPQDPINLVGIPLSACPCIQQDSRDCEYIVPGYGRLFYDSTVIGDNGVVEKKFPGENNQSSVKILDFESYKLDVSPNNEKFYSIPLSEFDGLKTSKKLTENEIEKCPALLNSHMAGLYSLLGYTVKAIEDVDIAPSITYFIKSGIKKITYKNVPPE